MLPLTGNTEIGQFQIASLVEHKILWLDISVYDALVVDRFKSVDQTATEKLSLFLREPSVSRNVVSKVTSQQQIHD